MYYLHNQTYLNQNIVFILFFDKVNHIPIMPLMGVLYFKVHIDENKLDNRLMKCT